MWILHLALTARMHFGSDRSTRTILAHMIIFSWFADPAQPFEKWGTQRTCWFGFYAIVKPLSLS